jgi:predicted ATPase
VGAPEETNVTILERLVRFMRERRALIVLDNCEHLLSECARLVERLAGVCPHLQFLATSREPLAIAGEQVYPVPRLGIPNAEPADAAGLPDLMDYASVRLLIERAGQTRTTFQLTDQNSTAIARICRQLDGIPLALEIAAAQLRTMSAHELAERLDERLAWVSDAGPEAPQRQKTLRALFDWSFETLSIPERTLFRRLAVFRGGLDVPAAIMIAYGAADAAAPLDELGTTPQQIVEQLLNALSDKSLLNRSHTADGSRYELLETLREYAELVLVNAGEREEMQARHLAYFGALVESASHNFFTAEQVKWLDHLEREHANLRAALAFSDSSGALDEQIHLTAHLGTFWQLRNFWTEGREWLRLAISRAAGAPPSLLLAKTYGCAGVLAWLQGDYQRALARHDKALELYRYLEDPAGIANALNNVALQYQGLGSYDEARALYDEALVLAREVEHPRLILRMLNNLSSITYLLSDLEASDRYSQEALTRARALGEKYALAVALTNRAQILLAQNDLDGALACSDEVVRVARDLGNQEFMAEGMRHKAMVHLKRGEAGSARKLYHASLRLVSDLGAKRQMIWSMEGLAMALAAESEWTDAARLFSAATTLRERTGIPKDAVESADHAVLQETLKANLGAARFSDVWEEGRQSDLDVVLTGALAL